MTKNELQKLLIKNLIKTHQEPIKAFKTTKNNLYLLTDKNELEKIAKKFDITI